MSWVSVISQIYDKWHYLFNVYKTFLIQHGKSFQENEIRGRWMLNIKTALLKGLASQVVVCRHNKSLFFDAFALKRAFIFPLIEASLLMWDFKRLYALSPQVDSSSWRVISLALY